MDENSSLKRVPLPELRIGSVLHTDIYDPEMNILIKKGEIINQAALDHLFAKSLPYVMMEPLEEAPPREQFTPTLGILEVLKRDRNEYLGLLKRIGLEECLPPDTEETLKEDLKAIFAKHSNLGDRELSRVMEMAILLEEVAGKKEHLFFRHSRAFTYADYEALHSIYTTLLLLMLLRGRQDREQAVLIGQAALLHNIGMQMIPREILEKKSKLNAYDFERVKEHSVLGYEILKSLGIFDEPLLLMTKHHHERYTGSGYPDRLSGEEVPELSTYIGICDFFDAITSDRVHMPAIGLRDAVNLLLTEGSDQFGFRTVQLFLQTIGVYPIGSIVRLNDGSLGVVVENSRDELNRPVVKIIYETGLREVSPPRTLDLLSHREFFIETSY